MEVVIKLIDLSQCLFGTVGKAHQFQVVRQNVLIGFQLVVDELQRTFPIGAARHVQQHDGHQGRLAGLNQRQHFQGFIQRAKATRAHDQSVCLLDEKQLAGEEEVEGQQVGRAIDRRVGALLKRQGDIKAQAVLKPRAFVGGAHDAGTASGNDHHVGACQCRTHFTGQCIQRVFYRSACRSEDRDFSAAFEGLQHTEGFFQLANSLQHDLGVPAIKIIVGHAQNSEQHFAIQRPVGAVGCDKLQLRVHVLSEVEALALEIQGQGITGLIGHALLLQHNIL